MARIYRIHTVRAAACAECRTHSSNLLLYAGYSNCTAELEFFSFFILFNVYLGFNVEITRTNVEFMCLLVAAWDHGCQYIMFIGVEYIRDF